jgi:hypothetical protein
MPDDLEPLFAAIRLRLRELGPNSHRRESLLEHVRSLGAWERDGAIYPDARSVEFPERIHVAYAICSARCGARAFIVDGSTQEYQSCGGLMFRTEVAEYRRA